MQFVTECFTGGGRRPPVLLGGVVEAVTGLHPGSGRLHRGAGISLLAAKLPPGVQLFPFHASTADAPNLNADQWRALLAPELPAPPGGSSGASGAGGLDISSSGGIAGLLLVEPHFTELEKFLSRLHTLLPPPVRLLGGVVAPGAAEPGLGTLAPGHGAVFLGSDCHHGGAVGCLFRGGPLRLAAAAVPSYRPVSPAMRVTASEGSEVMGLDGLPALLVLRQALEMVSQELGDAALPVHVGVSTAGDGGAPTAYVARSLSASDILGGSVRVATTDVPEGATLQLLLVDEACGVDGARRSLHELLGGPRSEPSGAAIASGEAAAAGGGGGGASDHAVLALTCTSNEAVEEELAEELEAVAAAGAAVQGARVQGELASAADGSCTSLHSFTTALGRLGPAPGARRG
eukprot:scaffold19.g1744.t1